MTLLTTNSITMGRASVVTSFVHYTEGNLFNSASEMYYGLNGNPHFSFAEGLLDQLDASLRKYKEAKIHAENKGKAEVFAKNMAKEELREIMSEVAKNVNLQAKGDTSLLISTLIPLCKDGKRHQELPAPELVKLSSGITHGEVVVDVPVNKNTRVYSIYYATMPVSDNIKEWNNLLSTKHKLTIKGLTPATQQAFRAGYLGTSGKVNLSEIFTIIVQ